MGAAASKNTGLHVLRVAEGSPSADAGIEPFFDLVVGYNGTAVSEDVDAFLTAVETAEQRNSSLVLQIWSTKREELRDVRIKPARDWSSNKTSSTHDAQPSLLGLSLRLCRPEGALEQVWHILDILEGSPAQAAGLVSYGDYVIGYAGGVLRGEGDFYNLIEEHADKPLRLFVYNSDFDVTREVVIVPNRDWGNGDSLLGCGVGYGLLHRIPKPQDRPAAPPELEDPEPVTNGHRAHPDQEEVDEEESSQGVMLVDTSTTGPSTQTIPRTAHPQTTNNGTHAVANHVLVEEDEE